MVNNLYEEYDSLPIPSASHEYSFSAKVIKGFPNHRIAKNRRDSPSLLIKVIRDDYYKKRIVSQKLYNLAINHNLECDVILEKKKVRVVYSVISFTGLGEELKEYFISICEILLYSIGKSPNIIDLKKAINKFIELFRVLNEPPKKSLQGLWAELLVIEQSKNPVTMMEGWHNNPHERFDFNFRKKRLEVKSAKSRKRVHHFSLEQLTPIKKEEISIISILVEESSNGIGINGLVAKISKKIKPFPTLIEKLNIIVFSTLRSDINKIKETYFDYELACQSMKTFNLKDIPKIHSDNIPKEVTNVKFQVSLENVPYKKFKL